MSEFDITLTTEGDYEERTTLTITWPDGTTQEESDGGETEDNSFGRDWSWVPVAIRRAYVEGKRAGAALPA